MLAKLKHSLPDVPRSWGGEAREESPFFGQEQFCLRGLLTGHRAVEGGGGVGQIKIVPASCIPLGGGH